MTRRHGPQRRNRCLLVPESLAPRGFKAIVSRHPRLWGAALAIALFVFYILWFRPARMWGAEHVAYPILQSVQTEQAERFSLIRIPTRTDAVYALERDKLGSADPTEFIRENGGAEWAAPVGVLFLLPGMFLLFAFPTRPYWFYLFSYHVVLGIVSFGVFVFGLGWFEPAFQLYLFARTYVAESVSLVVPLLLALAAHGTAGSGSPESASAVSKAA